MKILISIIVFGLITLTTTAQENPNLKIHEIFKANERSIPEQHITSNETGHYFLYSKGKYGYGDTFIKKFNTNFSPSDKEIYITKSNSEIKENSLGVFRLKNEFVHLFIQSNSTEKRIKMQTVDLNSFELKNTKNIKTITSSSEDMRKSYVSFFNSPDNETIGLIYNDPNTEKKGINFELEIFDSEFNSTNKYSYHLKDLNDDYEIVKGKLLNDNKFLLLVADYSKLPKNDFANKPIDYNYKILILEDNNIKNTIEVTNDNRWLNNLNIKVIENTISLHGYYSDTNRYSPRGVYEFNYDLIEHKILTKNFLPFSSTTIDNYKNIYKTTTISAKKILKNNELPQFNFKGVYFSEDGSKFIVGEQQYSISSNYSVTYFYKQILVSKISKNGDLVWSKFIKKDNSKTSTWIYSSFITQKTSNSLRFIYNDNELNLYNSKPITYNAFSNTDSKECLVLSEIDLEGKITQKIIAKISETDGYRIRPNLSNKIDDNRLLFFCQKPSNVRKQRFLTYKID